MFRVVLLLGFLAVALPARACWQEAGSRYQIDPALLYAIARTESALNPTASHRNRDGSIDIGLMQINSAWLPDLAKYGISARDLWEPCTNIHVGAWVLAQKIKKHGMTWEAVGAYNATTPFKRTHYAWKVYANLERVSRQPQP
jgi:soluble lytic murein transglycosylase-like protein